MMHSKHAILLFTFLIQCNMPILHRMNSRSPCQLLTILLIVSNTHIWSDSVSNSMLTSVRIDFLYEIFSLSTWKRTWL
jgi:hypothetical protein